MATRVSNTAAPTIDELEARAEAMLPRLRERAARAEELRRVPDETIDEFTEAGFFRVFQPARYGGYELDYGATQVALSRQLGRACGSSAWVQSVIACHAWLLGMFSEAAQEAVWANDPDALISTAIAMRSGSAQPVDGGYRVEGRWLFSSGIDSVQWIMILVPVQTEDGPPQMLLAILPQGDWQSVDTWFASGLRGTGSKDLVVTGAFVPEEYTVATELLDGWQAPGGAVNRSYIYQLPLFPVFPYNIATPALGIARGAVDEYITLTASRPDRIEQATRHLRIGESSAEVAAAEALLSADAAEVKRLGEAGERVPVHTRMKWHRDLAYAALLCLRAVDRIAGAVGAHGIYEPNVIQRAARDVRAIVNHAGLAWDTHGVNFGRVSVGLDATHHVAGRISARDER